MRTTAALCLALALTATRADAFCGFFVGKADAELFNQSSKVAIVRDGDRTVITMGNDYRGALTEFALVVPVPSVLSRDQIHVGNPSLLKHLDDYSAPRLVEYHDPDPCSPRYPQAMAFGSAPNLNSLAMDRTAKAAHGVKVEAEYTIGEYDIVLLSATQSEGLEAWLRESGYRIPPKAAKALAPYVRQQMKFFVAKVNLKEQKKAGFQTLRPIQIAFESPKFMLPIRLGMANADGPQDLIIFAITRAGRVESTNYQTVKVPSDVEVPEFVQKEFGDFYKATFSKTWKEHGQRALLTEYVWNMSWCDPCAAPPLAQDELREVGVFWLDGNARAAARVPGGGMPLMLTRLHVRYDGDHFPEDLMFQETGDQQNFQGRYILRHPFQGEMKCAEADNYRSQLKDRRHKEARTLAELTGWDMALIRTRMGKDFSGGEEPAPWWKTLWKK